MLAIYGPGEKTEEVLTSLNLNPKRFFSTIGGGEFRGIAIEPIDNLDETVSQLIITSSYFPQIICTLLERGFPISRVSIIYHDGLDNIVQVNPNDYVARCKEIKLQGELVEKLKDLYPGTENPDNQQRDRFRIESIRCSKIEGLNLEFGTYRGESIRTFAPHVSKMYGFDTFQGLPNDWTLSRPRGALDSGGLPQVPDNCSLVQGKFEDTLSEFLTRHIQPARFIFIDCDLYDATSFVLQMLENRFIKGSIILFDELIPLPEDFEAGEHHAWREFLSRSRLTFSFDARCGNAVRFICNG